ncbi:MAG: hypothetical protein IJZ85_00745 [Lachnospiraceae bacterium]|nr:hypothetical protein [Lachnospiraceae bacterium]
MKKRLLGWALVLALVFSTSTAQAAVMVEDGDTFFTVESVGNQEISPLAVTALTLDGLKSGGYKYSSSTYYVSGEDSYIQIQQLTWWEPVNDIVVGWYNTQTHKYYGLAYSGGNISNRTISSEGVPDGMYKIYVKNAGSDTLQSGTLQYSVE